MVFVGVACLNLDVYKQRLAPQASSLRPTPIMFGSA